MKTFAELKTDVLRYFDVAGEPDSSADVELVEQAINTANQLRATEDSWKFMLSGVQTLAVVAGQQEYILPHPNLHKLQYLYSTNRKMFAVSIAITDAPYNDIGFEQDQYDNLYYDLIGYSPVKVQPSSATTLTLASTDGDDAAANLYIEGEDSSGEPINEVLEVGNTTSQSFSKITYVAKASEFEGTLTLSTSGAVQLLSLTSSEVAKQYPVIKFYNIPSASETFNYRFFKRPRVMSRDNDLPDIPFPASNVLIYDALLSLATYNELDSESVSIWRDQQTRWETALYLHKMEGDTVGGRMNQINLVGSL